MSGLKPCGTDAAYRRHKSRGEEACSDCRRAHSITVQEAARRHRSERRAKRPCGTVGGFNRHAFAKEDPCSSCREANRRRYRVMAERRVRRVGQPDFPLLAVPQTSASFGGRVFSYIELQHPNSCWWWTGTLNAGGYGVVGRGPRGAGNMTAHRAVWELLLGPIPRGLVFDHLCRNPGCVNPHHGELVTSEENKRRGYGPGGRNSRPDVCPHGHPKDGLKLKKGGAVRYCKTCSREYAKRYALRSAA